MAETGRGVDSLRLFLTGGAANTDPADSLGGTGSSQEIRGMGPQADLLALPGIQLNSIFPANGVGDGTFETDSTGQLKYKPPGGAYGSLVTIAAGETKILVGADRNKAVRVTRESGLNWNSGKVATAEYVWPLTGALSHGYVSHAQRVAGVTTYRAIMLKAQGAIQSTINIRLWTPAVDGAQAVYSLATEALAGGVIQTIANETTAPGGLAWSTPTVEGSALIVDKIDAGEYLGLWIRRVFPAAGAVNAQEDFQLAIKYTAGV